MKRNPPNQRKTSLEINQSRLLVKIVGIITIIASFLHIVIGTNPIVAGTAGLAVILFSYPISIFGFLNIGAVLIALVGFRYIGFPLLAKLGMLQPLDTNLLDPMGAFFIIFLGLLGYLFALFIAANISVGKPLLKPTFNKTSLIRISFLAAIIGIGANLTVAYRAGEHYTGLTIAEFFAPFLHLALISSILRNLKLSKNRRSLDWWSIFLLISEIAFAMVQNSRMALMETFLCFIATVVAFETKIKWRQFGVTILIIGTMVLFVTPVFLCVRDLRSDLSWNQRIYATFETLSKWPDAFAQYQNQRDKTNRLGWYLNYYGRPQNVFERMTLVNHVDVLKVGSDTYGKVGMKDLSQSFKKTMPRILSPDKPLDYSHGSWLYIQTGLSNPGSFATAPLIGTGYAAFGAFGALCYPLILSLVWLLMVKKISGLRLQGNVWTIYLLLRIQNQFVEGSSDSYLMYMFRILPQDVALLLIVDALAKGRFNHPFRRKTHHLLARKHPE